MTYLGGRSAVVTGSSMGIGRAVALELAELGATDVLVNVAGIVDEGMKEASLNPAPAQYVGPAHTLLASDLAIGVTGRMFTVAGGYVGEFCGLEEKYLAYKEHLGGEKWALSELAGEASRADLNEKIECVKDKQ